MQPQKKKQRVAVEGQDLVEFDYESIVRKRLKAVLRQSDTSRTIITGGICKCSGNRHGLPFSNTP
jgi:hypothetical protein